MIKYYIAKRRMEPAFRIGRCIQMEAMMEKLKILADSAKYDVSCSSSGVGRRNNGRIGSAHASGICHSWGADGRCISLLKVLFTNKCVYDCEYCINRRSNDFPRASFEPDELARLTIEFYRRNYIEGLFLSSAVEISPDHTGERILEALRLLRYKYGFAGYIHAKVIPGISPDILHGIGLAADRLSVNIEMPTAKSLKLLAPQKEPAKIFTPMKQITNTLIERNALTGPGTMFKGSKLNTPENYLGDIGIEEGGGKQRRTGVRKTDMSLNEGVRKTDMALPDTEIGLWENDAEDNKLTAEENKLTAAAQRLPARRNREAFAPAGQTTQMIIGAAGETDRSILQTSESLYRTFKMKRVYYSAYIPVVESKLLPGRNTPPPLKREHRIYQADWLLRFYGFSVSELFRGGAEDLDMDMDPKVVWAIRNLDRFPVEVNKAPYEMLLRIPGVGAVSAKRIVRQRKVAAVRFDDLKKMGVVVKRAKYFVTCCGRYHGERSFEPETIRNSILQMEDGLQLSMFDTLGGFPGPGVNELKITQQEVM